MAQKPIKDIDPIVGPTLIGHMPKGVWMAQAITLRWALCLSLENNSKVMKKQNLICSSCGHTNSAKRITRGTFIAEVILWLTALFLIFAIPFIGGVLIVVAIIYSVWRLLSRRTECGYCGNTNLIPSNSPMGEKLIRDLQKGKEESQ